MKNMKYKIQGLIIGVILTSIVMFGFSVFAGTTQTIQAFYDNIKIIVNGVTLNPDVEPCIINGRTMVPIRFVADALGADSAFDDSQNAAVITSRINGTIKYTTGTFNGMKTVNMPDDVYISMKDALANKDQLLNLIAPTTPTINQTNQVQGVKKMDIQSNTAVSSVTATSSTTIDILFTAPVDKASMEIPGNYAIAARYGDKAELAVTAALIDATGTKLTLTTGEQKAATLYAIGIQSIIKAGNEAAGYCGMTFVGNAPAAAAPPVTQPITNPADSVKIDEFDGIKYVNISEVLKAFENNEKYSIDYRYNSYDDKHCNLILKSSNAILVTNTDIIRKEPYGKFITYDIWINKMVPYLRES